MIDILSSTKDELLDYAMSGIDFPAVSGLDMKKSIGTLRDEVTALRDSASNIVEPEAEATHIMNRITGHIFPFTHDLWKHLTDAVKCDKDGNRV